LEACLTEFGASHEDIVQMTGYIAPSTKDAADEIRIFMELRGELLPNLNAAGAIVPVPPFFLDGQLIELQAIARDPNF